MGKELEGEETEAGERRFEAGRWQLAHGKSE